MLLRNVSRITLVSIGLMGTGILYISFKYPQKVHNLARYIWTKYLLKRKKKIFIISEAQQWEQISDSFCRNAKAVSAIGFDCEWIQVQGKRRPVALMQLATHVGECALIRLNNINSSELPDSLKDLLGDKDVLKVGVSPNTDAQYLSQDYNIMVNGWLDLRHLVLRRRKLAGVDRDSEAPVEKMGLKALAKTHLGKTLSSNWRVRQGNWEAPLLAKLQVEYAAEDGLVGVQILLVLLRELANSSTFSRWPPFLRQQWETNMALAARHLARPYVEKKFKDRSSDASVTASTRVGLDERTPSPPKKLLKEARRSYSTRKSPLYHNCLLKAPDGETLCTIDPKKGQWYIDKGLGELQAPDPFTVRLRFEPAGRPLTEGMDGQFYLQERYNHCVVCGKSESYIRKNIVPHEYRKHFPRILKSHQSHDVVLLCTRCHQESNVKDLTLRYTLARELDAPIGCDIDVKTREDKNLKMVRSAAAALVKSRDKIPPARIEALQAILKKFFQTETLTKEQLDSAMTLDIKILNEEYVPHGYKVFTHYSQIGLIQLEKRWREWFLTTMQPQHLPENWSVTHNHEKLRWKMGRYPLHDPIRQDYKIALVGTGGEIDVPYVPQKNRRTPSSFFGLNEDLKEGDDIHAPKSEHENLEDNYDNIEDNYNDNYGNYNDNYDDNYGDNYDNYKDDTYGDNDDNYGDNYGDHDFNNDPSYDSNESSGSITK